MIKNEILKMHLQDKRTENSSREALTAEKLRTFPGFENASKKEAENMVYSIHTFCRIIYEYMIEQGNSFEVHNPINIAA